MRDCGNFPNGRVCKTLHGDCDRKQARLQRIGDSYTQRAAEHSAHLLIAAPVGLSGPLGGRRQHRRRQNTAPCRSSNCSLSAVNTGQTCFAAVAMLLRQLFASRLSRRRRVGKFYLHDCDWRIPRRLSMNAVMARYVRNRLAFVGWRLARVILIHSTHNAGLCSSLMVARYTTHSSNQPWLARMVHRLSLLPFTEHQARRLTSDILVLPC